MTDLITLPRATVKKALEALENSSPDQYPEDAGVFYDAKDALRAALEQPEQEQPVRAESVTTPPCKGMNCGAIDGRSHSLECHAEHSAAIAGGRFVPLAQTAALEQPVQEPVAWRFQSPLSEEGQWEYGKEPPVGSRWAIEPLYTHTPRREPLSDEELDRLWREPMSADWEHREFARAIEAAHGIKEEK